VHFKKTGRIKLLAIAGSPRRNGNTDILLDKAIDGAATGNPELIRLVLSEMCIAGCRHCDGCLPTGRCVVDDDAQHIHQLLREADRIILASPIFFMGVTAQTKAMIDRCQALWALKYILKLPVGLDVAAKRRGLFIAVGGMGFANLFDPAMATVKAFFKVLECDIDPPVTLSRVDEKGAILNHPATLQAAFEAGQKLVR